jgi:hypothetical protein
MMNDLEFYLKQIPSEHYDKPRFTSWLAAALDVPVSGMSVLEAFTDAFDVDFALGAQLDIIGQYAGVSRALPFQPSDGSSPLLSDELFRRLIKARIIRNNWDGTIPQVLELWQNMFPAYSLVVQDNQDMSMTLEIEGMEYGLEKELVMRGYIAPKPAGVRLDFSFITETPLPEKTIRVAGALFAPMITLRLPQYQPAWDFTARMNFSGRMDRITETTLAPIT